MVTSLDEREIIFSCALPCSLLALLFYHFMTMALVVSSRSFTLYLVTLVTSSFETIDLCMAFFPCGKNSNFASTVNNKASYI
jgi:hypothetical protein